MGRIPLVTSQIGAKIGRSEGNRINSFTTPDTFGAQKGRALGVVADGLATAARASEEYVEKKRNEKVANQVSQSDFTRIELEVRKSIGPDGAGLQEKTLKAFDEYVDQQANGIDDDVARERYRLAMAKERNAVSARSVTQEFSLDATYGKQQADASLDALRNKTMSNPSGYDRYLEQANAVIDTRTEVPATLREAMKEKHRQDSAAARFTGMMDSASTVEDIDRIAAELTASSKGEGKDDFVGRDWTREFAPEKYEQIVNQLGVARKTILTKADADARAALDTLDERSKDVSTLIPPEEMKAVAGVVKQSQNPITAARFSRIARDQDIIREARGLPVTEQRALINGTKGDPRTAHPGLPPRVSQSINKATEKFGVSGSYLAQTARREYGQFFKRSKANVDPKFAPQAVHGGVDLRNVRPDVAEAAAVAGQLYGEPMQVTSGWRSQTKQNNIRGRGNPNRASVAKHSHHTGGGEGDGSALDISTVGKSAADKARMVASLVDAGFTGVGEYDTHIHVDMRDAAPGSFGERDGKTWGGWTYLSPEVAATLKERGYGAGVSAKDIKRSSPVQYADDIDYGKGTQILRDDGRPTSGAVGINQFIPSTWLGVMKDPAKAAKIGVDVSGMSDDQILELRKDPDISIMAGAALAEDNARIISGTIGRQPNDPELYMAHFLGADGAIALIKAKEGNPRQSAAELLPKAANANKPVFYRNGKALSVEEMYNRISREFVAEPGNVQYGDVQTRERIVKHTETQLKEDPMGFVQQNGSHDVPEFTAENMQAYGTAVRSVAEYYSLPISEMKVIREDDVNALKRTFDEGTTDEVLAAITSMQDMGSDVARAAFKQIGQTDNVYGYAGSLNLETGQSATASDIIRGQKRLNDNADIKKDVDADAMEGAFRVVTGNALNEVSPKVRQDIQDAAFAHYVETAIGRGKVKPGSFDPTLYANSVQAVMGGTSEAGAVGEVNGEPTVLPPGVSAETLETAMQNMGTDDWAVMSKDGLPPRYLDGSPIDPNDLADEARLRAVGAGEYKVQLDDGSFAVTGELGPNGRLNSYIFKPDPDKLAKIGTAPEAADDGIEPPPPEVQQSTPENVFSQFDEYGRWKGPKQ